MGKWLKTEVSIELSTLSTENEGDLGDYSRQIKEQAFCEEIMKMIFLTRKRKKILTIKKSNIGNKTRENVYTMRKSDYNKYDQRVLLKESGYRRYPNHMDKRRNRYGTGIKRYDDWRNPQRKL